MIDKGAAWAAWLAVAPRLERGVRPQPGLHGARHATGKTTFSGGHFGCGVVCDLAAGRSLMNLHRLSLFLACRRSAAGKAFLATTRTHPICLLTPERAEVANTLALPRSAYFPARNGTTVPLSLRSF